VKLRYKLNIYTFSRPKADIHRKTKLFVANLTFTAGGSRKLNHRTRLALIITATRLGEEGLTCRLTRQSLDKN